jgi:hypothetical protein
MHDEFENALAWFSAAPAAWIESGRKNLAACAEWIWEVLQGDFHENASTAQIATGTVISMIPGVDQLCDLRDVAANCKQIKKEPTESAHWFSLGLTLIGLFPTLGSLFKGCLKVAFSSARKAGAIAGVTPRVTLVIDKSVAELTKFLGRPEVTRALKALHWYNPYKILAGEIRKIAEKLNIGALLSAFNDASKAAEGMLDLVQRWGSTGLAKEAGELIETIANVRRSANRKLGEALKPIQDFLDKLARRLDIEADMSHRAYLDTVNPHAFIRVTESQEAAAFAKAKPRWVDKTGKLTYDPIDEASKAPPGWTSTVPDPKRGKHPLDNAHETFHTMQPQTLPPGTVLYRIVDPTSKDNSICWMTKAEFDKLKTKEDWRRRFAVWAHWNSNGEFVTYIVPPGPGLNVWEGVTASQRLKQTDYVLEGGARQIVVDPAHLEKSHLGPRQKTGWGYDELGTANSFVGVPVLKNSLIERKGR